MALAATRLAAEYPGAPLGQRIWFVASDGDLMEGVSHEAASLAGHLRLRNLIGFFDDNRITIDGSTDLACSDDVTRRFEAYGWRVLHVLDGNDLDALDAAMQVAAASSDGPTLIVVRTHIAYGSPNKQDTAEAHGAPLGADEIALTRANLGWNLSEPFEIPPPVLQSWRGCVTRGARLHAEWRQQWKAYVAANPDAAATLSRRLAGELPADWDAAVPRFCASDGNVATRVASGVVLNALAARLPELCGGSADLAPSNNTLIKGAGDFSAATRGGRNLRFGIREHAMGAVMNGMALYGGFLPYGATFLVFSDYLRPAIRLAALMGLHVVYVFTHDSIGLGEDGPTHQPVEHLAALRAIPNLIVLRPADAHETAAAWRFAVAHRGGPVALALTRQKTTLVAPSDDAARAGVARGAYIVAEEAAPRLILLASGSEVGLAIAAGRHLRESGVATRVVSVPSLELWARQVEVERTAILPLGVPVLAVEAAHPQSWWRWVGGGDVLGIEAFGASAPADTLFREYGFSVEALVDRARALLARGEARDA
jgi:transketolase